MCEKVLASINFKLKDVYNDILVVAFHRIFLHFHPSVLCSVCVMNMTSSKYSLFIEGGIREIGEFD